MVWTWTTVVQNVNTIQAGVWSSPSWVCAEKQWCWTFCVKTSANLPKNRITENSLYRLFWKLFSFAFVCAECVVMAAEDKSGANDGSSSNITVKLQGKDKDSSQEFSLHKVGSFSSLSGLSFVLAAGQKRHTVPCVCFRMQHWVPYSTNICPRCLQAPRERSASISMARK